MGVKLLLNILYNLAIILCVILAYWSTKHQRYDWLVAGLFIIVVVIFLKIKLAKEVRELQKNQKN